MSMMRRLWRLLLTVLVILWATQIQTYIRSTSVSSFSVAQWSLAQWIPSSVVVLTKLAWEAQAWDEWEKQFGSEDDAPWEVSGINLRNLREPAQILQHLESRHGKDWRKRPLLLKELWNATEIHSDKSRRLSLSGLLQEDLMIPYFRDATIPGALTPDSQGRISEIVANITKQQDCRHKITTQLMLQTYPELIHEVAPVNILTELFGDFFEPDRVKGTGPFHLFPAMTTVPMFVARSANTTTANATAQPRTDLHCEPIGNVAVQLEGSKQWTLVLPQDSFRLRPLLAPDGRAYVASMVSTQDDWKGIPRAQVVTHAGDALWVPPWTWHRVDYVGSTSEEQQEPVSLGASLFHFRPKDFFLNNPLFAMLILPSLFKELIGYNTQ